MLILSSEPDNPLAYKGQADTAGLEMQGKHQINTIENPKEHREIKMRNR